MHEADGDRADVGARLVEGLHRELEALARGREHVRCGDVHVLEHHLRGVARALPELVLVLADA